MPRSLFAAPPLAAKLFAALSLACLGAGAPACAQEYPSKPLRLIVPNSAGGAIDVTARILQPRLSAELRQPIVIDNRVAAGGTVGTQHAAQSAPDGYTLLIVFDSFTTNPFLFRNVQYDPSRDFAPIMLVARYPQVFAVHPSLGVKNLKEFLQLARAKGSALDFATAGAGTSSRLSLELFKIAAGVEPTAVHYKGGAPALNDLAGGQVVAMIVSTGAVIQFLKNGRLVPLAVTSDKRTPLLPDVPPMAETLPGFEAQGWVGMLAPAGTPAAIISRLNAALVKTLAAPDVREKLEGQGAEIVAGSPEAFGAWVRSESAKWGRLIRDRNITID